VNEDARQIVRKYRPDYCETEAAAIVRGDPVIDSDIGVNILKKNK